jgi:hypothetical protein
MCYVYFLLFVLYCFLLICGENIYFISVSNPVSLFLSRSVLVTRLVVGNAQEILMPLVMGWYVMLLSAACLDIQLVSAPPHLTLCWLFFLVSDVGGRANKKLLPKKTRHR